MKLFKFISLLIVLLTSNLMLFTSVNAHLMVAQQGTLNIVDSDAFVVISLPISAFDGVDSNQDGVVTMIEFNHNRDVVTQILEKKFRLIDNGTSSTLVDILLSPVQDHHSKSDGFSQLTVMGRFNLKNLSDSFELKADLFGTTAKEKALKITMKRASDKLIQVVQITPESPFAELKLIK